MDPQAEERAPVSKTEFWEPAPVRGLSLSWLFAGDCIRVTRWRCLESVPGLTEERSQPWHVLGFVHTGSFRLHARAGTGLIDPNRILFLNAGQPYQTSHPCGCGDAGTALVVRSDVLRALRQRYEPHAADSATLFSAAHGPCPSATLLRQRALARALSRGTIDGMAAEENALAIVEEVLAAEAAARPRRRGLRRPETLRRRREVIDAARVFLLRNATSPLRLAGIAAAAGVSPAHLSRVFRAEMGEPVHRYLTRLRLRRALPRLADGCRELTGLALELGFSSHSHFTAAFRREFGICPSEYSRESSRLTGLFPCT